MDIALQNYIERAILSSQDEALHVLEFIAGTLMADNGEGSLLEELESLYGNNTMDSSKDGLFERLQWLCNYYNDNFTTLVNSEEEAEDD